MRRHLALVTTPPAPRLNASLDPAQRGYGIVYRQNEVNHCPGCGRSQWYVGRLTAECAFCFTALGLADSGVGISGRGWR